ncbi:MAG: hypothetical protein QM734_10305 [Cyclobacteriaceae bacterium]
MNGNSKNTSLKLESFWNNNVADRIYHDRTDFSEFAKRPITTGIQKILNVYLKIPFQFSFNLIVLTSLFFSCMILSRIAKKMDSSRQNYLAIYFFILSCPILLGFLGPMHMYDEPVQFFLILLSMLMFIQKKELLAVIIFSIACVSRETSFLLLPYFLINRELSAKQLLWFIPIIVYFLFFFLILDFNLRNQSIDFTTQTRFNFFKENFFDLKTSLVSLINAFLVIGLPLIVATRAYQEETKANRRQIKLFLVIVIVNTILVFITALAKEPRLFLLPLLLIWPMIPSFISKSIAEIRELKLDRVKIIGYILISLILAFAIYQPAVGKIGFLFKSYLSIYTFTIILFSFEITNKKTVFLEDGIDLKHSK